ncbi:(2,3-dihydroxybenzoyl)adenylate synthase [Amycolatopsis anabasis]|uniref:(2,3-dihydroxybenzoyl)adenylate synthase n=1 Tax=Amycolatopsis anabasis TaxID=1840409 RepID=UPI00131CC39A|nr:AMP-binding protein [Amycolatopsis anabasis]
MSVRDGFTPWPEADARRYRALGYWRGVPLGDVFAEQAVRVPDHLALVDGSRRWTYLELAAAVDDLADRLAERGLAGECLVSQLPNVAEFVLLTLACFRSGVVPVMALPQHRRADIAYLLELTGAAAYAVPDRYRDFDYLELATEVSAEAPALREILVRRSAAALDFVAVRRTARPAGEPGRGPEGGDIAVLLLSGGTTGRPKLIPRTHDDYALNARANARACAMDERTVYLVALPAAHNFALACPGILGVLFSGGTVVLSDSPAPEKVFGLIERHRVTHTAAVPAVAHRWADASGSGGCDLSSLRTVAVGGSRLAPELARRIEAALDVRVQQGFGMAEGLINYTLQDDPPEVRCETQGRPVCAGDEIRIVDEADRDVPEGEAGELLARGPYTIRGYYRAPEHNARCFTADGWYRTGDVVRWHPSGNLVVEGRTKDIINRGGEKISAEEVENLAYGHPAVADAAAVPIPDPELGERICLYVVGRVPGQPTLEDLRQHMTLGGAAAFKLPEVLRLLPELPTTNVGKVDKKALRADAATRAGRTR